MARRPLVATVVTTAIGAVLGTVLGALVGRVIAFFGDATIEVSVPVIFCGTLGYFVGGASAAKGCLDRFGARRSALGGFVAAVLLIVIVGAASLSRQPGAVIVVLGVVAVVVAGVAATAVGAPQPAPVARGGLARPVPSQHQAEARPEETIEAEYLDDPAPTPSVSVSSGAPRRPAVRKVAVAPEAEPAADPVAEPEPVAEGPANWVLADEPAPEPNTTAPPRPRRDRPLRRSDVPAADREPPEITPPPAPRQKRERPARKGDS